MKIRLGRILENAARLSGRIVGTMGVTENQRALAGMAVSDGIRRIAAEKFPMMQRFEFRRFRPTWTDDGAWSQWQECWYGESYWRLVAAASAGAPGTDGSGWEKVEPHEIAAFVAYEQPWENTIIDRGSVDLVHFAYTEDPRYHPAAAPLAGCRLNELGVIIPAKSEEVAVKGGVWARFVPKYPNVSFVEWVSTAAYEARDVAYVGNDKEVYQCISGVTAKQSGNTSPSQDGEHWQAMRISDEFETYLTRLAAADLMTEDQGKYATKASAEREFEELCARYLEGVSDGHVRVGRFM